MLWKLPRHCHTSLLHCTSGLQSLYNVVSNRSISLCQRARASGSPLVCDIFKESLCLAYTSFGLNVLNDGGPTPMLTRCVPTSSETLTLSRREQRTCCRSLLFMYTLTTIILSLTLYIYCGEQIVIIIINFSDRAWVARALNADTAELIERQA